jgi:hypothetical protein
MATGRQPSTEPQLSFGNRVGASFLHIPEVAKTVTDAIRHRDRHLRHYQLHAFVVMPNHGFSGKFTRPIDDRPQVYSLAHRFKARQAYKSWGQVFRYAILSV